MHVNPTSQTTSSFDTRRSRRHRVSPARHLLQLTPWLLRTLCLVPRSHTRRVPHLASTSSSTTRVLMLSKSHRMPPFDCLSYPVCFVRMRQARGRGSSLPREKRLHFVAIRRRVCCCCSTQRKATIRPASCERNAKAMSTRCEGTVFVLLRMLGLRFQSRRRCAIVRPALSPPPRIHAFADGAFASST